MKKIWIAVFLALMLAGCKVQQEIKLDTIVDIPLNPTEESTEAVTETQPADETVPTETERTTEATWATTPSSGKNNSSKNSAGSASSKSGTKKPNTGSSTKATQPPTEPPTDPPTEPPTQAPTNPPSYDPGGYTPGSLDRGVIDAVNARRAEAGLDPLSADNRLCAIASVRAYEACLNWSHTRPDGSSFTTVLGEYGFSHTCAAESIFNTYATPSAAAIVDKWMGSDANRVNILSEDAVKIGVGTYTAADGAVYTAALFVA